MNHRTCGLDGASPPFQRVWVSRHSNRFVEMAGLCRDRPICIVRPPAGLVLEPVAPQS